MWRKEILPSTHSTWGKRQEVKPHSAVVAREVAAVGSDGHSRIVEFDCFFFSFLFLGNEWHAALKMHQRVLKRSTCICFLFFFFFKWVPKTQLIQEEQFPFSKQNRFSFRKGARDGEVHNAKRWCKAVCLMEKVLLVMRHFPTFMWKETDEFLRFLCSRAEWMCLLQSVEHSAECKRWFPTTPALMHSMPEISLPAAAGWGCY